MGTDPGLLLLSNKHQEIARRLLRGESQAQIAREMGMSQHALSTLVSKNQMFKNAMLEVNTIALEKTFNMTEFMRGHEQDAAKLLVEVMKDPDQPTGTRIRAANDVLGYAGHKKANTSSVNVVQMSFEERLRQIEKVEELPAIDQPPSIEAIEESACQEQAGVS